MTTEQILPPSELGGQRIAEATALLRKILAQEDLGPNQGLSVARALAELSNATLDDFND